MRTLLAAACLLAACAGEPDARARGKPAACAVNYPLAYFAERIAGDSVEVRRPFPADGERPDDAAIETGQQADLILLNGAGYAKWLEQTSLPPSKCVHTSASFEKRYIAVADAVTHGHGPKGTHAHGGWAFTTWLDPTLAVEHAEAIREALVGLLPEQAAALNGRFEDLERDLLELDRQLQTAASRKPLLGSHPVYQYLARRYGLDLRSVHWEPREMPDAKAWQELEALLWKHPARCMLWEAEPRAETAARLKALGVRSVVFDPCGTVPAKGDFLSVMKSNAAALRQAFGE